MIVEQDENLKIEQTRKFKRKKYTIASTREAFMILSKGIYSDPITAIIRELGTNAVDGHVSAGNVDEPFDVHLPTQLDPVFRVRDYGCSLTPEMIEDIYTTYFESTKRQSDEHTGSLGLGSKSPFAIVSSFLVTTFIDGVKTIYSAIIAEDGCPDIVEMGVTTTDERNGVEVKFSVPAEDIYNFESRARIVYSFFDTIPNVYHGSRKVDIERTKYDYKNEQFGVVYTGYYSSESHKVVMSNVAYDIELGPLAGKISAARLSVLNNSGNSYHMFVKNGAVNFVASREHLEYTPKTIATIDRMIDAVLETVRSEYNDLIKAPATYIEACEDIANILTGRKQSTISNDTLKALANDEMDKAGHILWKKHKITRDNLKTLDVSERQSFTKDEVITINNAVAVRPGIYPSPIMLDTNGNKAPFGIEFKELTRRGSNFSRDVTYKFPVGSTTIILNDGKLAQYKISDYIGKNVETRQVIVLHGTQKSLAEKIRKAAMIEKVVLTSNIDVTDIQRAALAKTIRVFTTGGEIRDIQLDYLDKIRYYVIARGSAYTFDMLDRIHSYDEAKDVITSMSECKLFGLSERIAILPASSSDKILDLYPKMQPLKTLTTKLEWTSLSEPMQYKVIHSRLGVVNKLGHIPYSDILMRTLKSDIDDLNKYIEKYKQLYSKAQKFIEKYNRNRYRYSQISDGFGELLSKQLVNDTTFKTELETLSTFITQQTEVNKIFPILTLQNAGDLLPPSTLMRYIEVDWETNNQQKELNND